MSSYDITIVISLDVLVTSFQPKEILCNDSMRLNAFSGNNKINAFISTQANSARVSENFDVTLKSSYFSIV